MFKKNFMGHETISCTEKKVFSKGTFGRNFLNHEDEFGSSLTEPFELCIEIFFYIFFICNLTTLRPTLVHCPGNTNSHLIFIPAFYYPFSNQR